MRRRSTPTVVIVTPYLAQANNGNWRTARRWAGFLRASHRVILQADWNPEVGVAPPDLLIALHARRSAGAIRRFAELHPARPIVVCLTGTDLYKDLPADDVDARESIGHADALIVLQDEALLALPADARRKAIVIYQSARALAPAAKSSVALHSAMVGHLRPEKDPLTVVRAIERLPRDLPVTLTHVGAALDPAIGAVVAEAVAREARYRWLGGRPHAQTRQIIRRAHLLIHPSVMEGGANVVVEAVTAGTPVLASRMSGNVGMLGRRYAGYFPVGDDGALAVLIERCVRTPRFLERLARQCRDRAALFAPETERAGLHAVVDRLLAQGPSGGSRRHVRPAGAGARTMPVSGRRKR